MTLYIGKMAIIFIHGKFTYTNTLFRDTTTMIKTQIIIPYSDTAKITHSICENTFREKPKIT